MFLTNRVAIGAVVASGLFNMGCLRLGARVWTPMTTENLQFSAVELTALEVRTHNGHIKYSGSTESVSQVAVTVAKKGGGQSSEEADEALQAIEVFYEATAKNRGRLGWRWKQPKESNWQAEVSFTISGPAQLDLDVQTHNGEIVALNVDRDLILVTHNGSIESHSAGPKLVVETHNGEIKARSSASDVQIGTHNGGIELDLRGSHAVKGTVTTHNGEVDLKISEKTATHLTCRTHNGRITNKTESGPGTSQRQNWSKQFGGGGSPLTIETHNGPIEVQTVPAE